MKKNTFYALLLLLITTSSFAQTKQIQIETFTKATGAKVSLNETLNTPSFIRFPKDNTLRLAGKTLEAKALNFLNVNKALYDLSSVEDELILETTKKDRYGFSKLVFKQVFNGVPIFDGKLIAHFNKEERLTSINGTIISALKINTVPKLTQAEANAIAILKVNDQNINYSGVPISIFKNTLYIFKKGLVQRQVGANYLVYEIELRNEVDVREFLYINAHDGRIVEQFTGMAHALDRVVYEVDTSTIVWQEGDVFPGTLTSWQRNEVEASAHTYNFFKNAFGYSSYDGEDAQMRTINNDPRIACPNANWNGVTANYCDGSAADDVIAHEWGHAYTQFTSGLIYAFQSGAMNEAYSDIWGETIDVLNAYEDTGEDASPRTACNSSERWRMGEDASAFGGAIRDMWDPTCNGHPGKVTDGVYRCGSGDAGGVHSNSGIVNHAYALLVDGGTYNGQTIASLGFTKAAHIFWRAQSEYLSPTSNFSVLADALEMSVTDLVGEPLEGLSTAAPIGVSNAMITTADIDEVTKAVLAVELRINPDACGYIPLLAPSEDLCEASTSSSLYFEDWESGTDGWTISQLPGNPTTWEAREWELSSDLPQLRPGNGVFGIDPVNGNCTDDFENGVIRLESPIITIPTFTEGHYDLAFNHYISTEESWDGGNVKYRLDGGAWTIIPVAAFTVNPYNSVLNTSAQGNDNPMQGEIAFTGSDGGSTAGSWGRSVIDLSEIGVVSNTSIQFRWEVGTDGCNGRIGWYIDEVMVYNCSDALSVDKFIDIEALVSISPNPSRGIYNLKKVERVDLQSATIYDLNGRVIQTIDLSNIGERTVVDITNMSSGLYFMMVSSNNEKAVVKLVKQ